MYKLITLSLISILLYSCAAYKELKPKPPVSPLENGYIEIKKDEKKPFELKKDKKYFMVFPPAVNTNVYLILDLKQKDLLHYYLTETFDQGKGRIIEIPDESPEPDRLSVYPISNDVPRYYWVIDLVKQDLKLELNYRYVARWRFKFERQYDQFREILAQNTIDRELFETLGSAAQAEQIDLKQEIEKVSASQQALLDLKGKLKEIEDIFPDNIRNTNDEAFQNYLQLKEELNDELNFQQRYLNVLALLKNERDTRASMEEFFALIPDFMDFFSQREEYPANVLQAVREVLKKRLDQVVPYYKTVLESRNSAARIESAIPQIEALYPAAGLTPGEDFKKLAAFVGAFNQTVEKVEQARQKFVEITNRVKFKKQMPSSTFFSDIVTRLSKLQYNLPRVDHPAIKPYRRYLCVKRLKGELQKLTTEIRSTLQKYRRADSLVPRINTLKAQKNVRGILSLLKKNPDLDFLAAMYRSLDKISLKKQANKIRRAMTLGDFKTAEMALKTLYNDKKFVDYKTIRPVKERTVANLQDSLVNAVVDQSRLRAKKFVEENLTNFADVPALYENPAFRPVYELTFFAAKPNSRKKFEDLKKELKTLQTITFPGKAIKLLYDQLISDPSDHGVEKARAIVAHGSHYRGTSASIKKRVAECDPNIAKLITKPKDYRRVFALPVTNRPDGMNEYLFKVNLRIPSPAQYPVFDVYIRLPKELAEQAGSTQWYKRIVFNGEVIKNEGRYTIVAPGPDNNYECQVGPLQMVKTRNNILEVRFNKPGFKVYQISVMAQKPIIKKH